MDWWAEVRLVMGQFLDQHGLLAAFVFLLIEEAGVPVPVPGDFLMLLLGVQARQGTLPLWQAIVAMEGATVAGATLLYVLSRWAGRGLVYRYGRYIRLSPESLDRAEVWIQKRGFRAVFLGRLLPGLRIVTAVACGVFEVPARVFIPAMSLGALLYIVVYTLLGYYFGPPVLDALGRLHLPGGLLVSLLLLTLILVWVYRARRALAGRTNTYLVQERKHRLRAGALAGLLATVAATLLTNLVVNLAGNLAFQAPGTIVEQTAARLATGIARDLQPVVLFVAAPLYLFVGVMWGMVYGGFTEGPLHFPDWVNGIVFAALPLATSLGIVMPLLGLGFFGVGATGPVAAVGELIRHLVFGAVLGLTFPIFLVRRQVRVLPHTRADLPPAPEEALAPARATAD